MDIRKKLKLYLEENLEEEKKSFFGLKRKSVAHYSGECECCSPSHDEIEDEEYERSANFEPYAMAGAAAIVGNFIDKELDENKFQKLLFEHIDKRNLKDSDVYNKAQIDRRLFSKIRSDENYHPSKETIISLATSLELTIDELEELLDSASYSLPKNNKFDLIIRFCFIEKIYDIMEINNLLDEYRCPLLTK